VGQFADDGELQTILVPRDGIGIVDSKSPVEPCSESAILSATLLNAPAPDGIGINDASLESFLAHGRLLSETEFFNERECHVVECYIEGNHYATLWLDVERDLMPMRCVEFGHNDTVSSALEVLSAAPFENGDDNGLWLPTSWRSELLIRGDIHHCTYEIAAEATALNPPLDEVPFRLAFPPGTRVTDYVRGLAYIVPASGEEIEIIDTLEALADRSMNQ
jgi:hypothetical protein